MSTGETSLTHCERFFQNVKDLSELVHELVVMCYENGTDCVNPMIVKLGGAFLGTMNKNTIMDLFMLGTILIQH